MAFWNKSNRKAQEQQEVLDYEWLLAPELDTDVLTDASGMVLAIDDAVAHIDGGLQGWVENVDFSPFYGEEHLLMAYVVWDMGAEGTASDWIAGYLLEVVW